LDLDSIWALGGLSGATQVFKGKPNIKLEIATTTTKQKKHELKGR
jgi:hypothetical protein